MKKRIEKIASQLKLEEDRTFVRRVAWLDLEKKVRHFYDALSQEKGSNAFGDFYLSSNQNTPPYSTDRRIYKLNSLNQIQISSGQIISGIFHEDSERKCSIITEKNATLWFSQDITGRVSIFMSPYLSQTHRVDEENVLIKSHRDPTTISENDVESFIEMYLNYCAATMASGAFKRLPYMFRLKLQLNDLRNRKRIKDFLTKLCIQTLALVLAAMGVLATLYTGKVFPF